MSDKILEVKSLSKKFTLKTDGNTRPSFSKIIKTLMGFPVTLQESAYDFWALNNISFDLHRGESIGIVGLNGAGKSTLLKILLERLVPDRGTVTCNGSIGGLIELGAGFHPEQTGRKNILINARLLGANEREIEDKLELIIKFSELGEYIDMPVKTYSSGMNVRLGFSIAIHFVRDLVILDEVLAVGDFEFKQKCHRLIHKLKNQKSFVLVSHNTRDINLFCDKAMLLHKGHMIDYGKVDDVMKSYSLVNRSDTYEILKEKIANRKVIKKQVSKTSFIENDIVKNCTFAESEDYRIGKFGRIYKNIDNISDIRLYTPNTIKNGEVFLDNSERFQLTIEFKLLVDVSHIRIGLPFFSENGQMVVGPDSREETLRSKEFSEKGKRRITFEFKECPVVEGRYLVCLAINNDPGFLYRDHIFWINVKNSVGLFGMVKTNSIWKYEFI